MPPQPRAREQELHARVVVERRPARLERAGERQAVAQRIAARRGAGVAGERVEALVERAAEAQRERRPRVGHGVTALAPQRGARGIGVRRREPVREVLAAQQRLEQLRLARRIGRAVRRGHGVRFPSAPRYAARSGAGTAFASPVRRVCRAVRRGHGVRFPSAPRMPRGQAQARRSLPQRTASAIAASSATSSLAGGKSSSRSSSTAGGSTIAHSSSRRCSTPGTTGWACVSW